jgi:hypothetical protein
MAERLRGRVVHIRKVSKNIMFVDILQSSADSEKRICLIFKFWETVELKDRSTRGQDKIHVGDILSCSGTWDKEYFSVNDYSFIERWSESGSGKVFTPIPPDTYNIEVRKNLPCKFFVNTGHCAVENCGFTHPVNLKESRKDFLNAKAERRLRVHEEQFPGEELKSSSKRAELFKDWILATFGTEYLSSGCILDVAGGRGDLAFELGVLANLVCNVVDPRPTKLKRWQTKVLKKTGKPLPAHYTEYFDADFFEKTKLNPADIRLVIGMHPDEATEAIVDTALKQNLPFAVVPCCVFSALFPERKLKSGLVPTNYPDFCTYLAEKHDSIQTTYLPYLGRNMVIFTTPKVNPSDLC